MFYIYFKLVFVVRLKIRLRTEEDKAASWTHNGSVLNPTSCLKSEILNFGKDCLAKNMFTWFFFFYHFFDMSIFCNVYSFNQKETFFHNSSISDFHSIFEIALKFNLLKIFVFPRWRLCNVPFVCLTIVVWNRIKNLDM